MTERCQVRCIVDGKAAREMPRCLELAVLDRLYCPQHLYEALLRVAMVSPVGPVPLRYRGQPRGSMLNTRKPTMRGMLG